VLLAAQLHQARVRVPSTSGDAAVIVIISMTLPHHTTIISTHACLLLGAQVHRARVRVPSATGNADVVVKVRHPGVATSIFRDFQLLKPLAGFASRWVDMCACVSVYLCVSYACSRF